MSRDYSHYHTCLLCGRRWLCDQPGHWDEYPGVFEGQGYDVEGCDECGEDD